MVLPLLPIIAAGAPTILAIGTRAAKFAGKYPTATQSITFGIGYGASTNVGYNLSNSFITPGFRRKSSYTPRSYNLSMPYGSGYYPRRRYSRYSRPSYGSRRPRYYRRYSRNRRYY